MSETTDRVSVAVARHVRMAMKMVRKARAKWGWTITRIGAWEDQLGLEGVVIEWAKPFSSALAYDSADRMESSVPSTRLLQARACAV